MSPHFPSISAKSGLQDEGAAALSRLGIGDLAQALAFGSGKVRREVAGRRTQEIVRPGRPSLFLKQYFAGKRFAWRSALTQARAEARAFADLREAGLPVPKLLAWYGAKGRGAFLLWEGIPGEPLDDVLEAGYPIPSGQNLWQSKISLIEAAAQLVRKLHERGRVHRDLYLCHIVFGGFRGLEPQLALIDLQRVTIRRMRRWFVKDLAALLSSCPRTVSRADKWRFLLAWLGRKKSDRFCRRWAKAIVAKARRIRAHRPKFG